MGALCTLSTYLLMIIYMVNLMIAFNDGSRQEEKIQSIDIQDNDRYNLTDNGMVISYMIYPPIAPEIGRFISQQQKHYQFIAKEPERCQDDYREFTEEYWLKRISSDDYLILKPLIRCILDSDEENFYV